MKIAGYCRLSRDEDKENYSSINEQKNIIKDYAISRNWFISDDDFYVDDNFSGYIFDRPDFTKMMSKVQKGEIDVVIAKDLSRIGRWSWLKAQLGILMSGSQYLNPRPTINY